MTSITRKIEDETEDSDLYELFLAELADVLHAEKQLTAALPEMAEAAVSDDLRAAFQSHLEETEGHITRLEEVFSILDEPIESKECKAMKGLLEEGKELMEEMEDSSALDAALIAAAQKVEHYEIASYGTLSAWAEKLGYEEAARLLDTSLEEEKAADEKLTTIAASANSDAEF